ncbi:recombinase family protein [Streptosporangium sp. NBC_01755]|uniref:recombinase family protein n=1 Tax=Streptosporangium sp. NBC_01755 TaxID=2975949 RepID=UPI002DDC8CF4|nr:recombinase family protein [Streptosporangium sp. NBC_01755]WSD03750.1 recombinase family protein [Streptosporangium sp. NBC_01755]
MPPRTTTPAEPIPAIGYIRVSMLQEEQISPDIQRNAIDDWARRQNRKIVRWIEDLDASGRTFHRKIMEGIEAIEAGAAVEIVVWKYSRYGRTRTGNAVNLGRINRAGGELQSATEEVDARTAVGKLTRGMLMEIAAFESDRAGEQWAEAHENRRARGLPANGRPRFGYVLRGRVPDPLQPNRTIRQPDDGDERYEINPTVGPILAEAYRRYISGASSRALAGWLNELGIRGTRDQQWSSGVLLRTLDSGFGAGLIQTHDPNCTCQTPSGCPTTIHIPGAHTAVITEEEWQAYRRRRRRVKRTAPRARVTLYPLSGLIRCGHCTATMTIATQRGVVGARYFCGAYMRKKLCRSRSVLRLRVEALVLTQLMTWADDIESRPEAAPVRPAEAPGDIQAFDAEIERLDAALDRLTRKLAMDLVPEDTYGRTRDELLAERATAAARRERLTRPQASTPRTFVPMLRALGREWPTLEAALRREMTAELIAEVRIFRTDTKVAWVEIDSVWGETSKIAF